jgi:hypothetical protein
MELNTITTLLVIVAAIAFIVIVAHFLQRILVDRRYSQQPAHTYEVPHYPKLNGELRCQLEVIEPSQDSGIAYKPCLVTLQDGRQIDNVYVVSAQQYSKYWGLPPKRARGKQFLQIQDIVKIDESPSRLPTDIANEIYQAGESRMGSYHFTLIFSDGSEQEYMTGDAVDFVPFPAGKTNADIVKVIPGFGVGEDVKQGLKYYWCLFD